MRVADDGTVVHETSVERLNTDLTSHADVASAAAIGLLANRGLSSQGFTLVGEGFRLDPDEGRALLSLDPRHAGIVRPIRSGETSPTARGVSLLSTLDCSVRRMQRRIPSSTISFVIALRLRATQTTIALHVSTGGGLVETARTCVRRSETLPAIP